MKKKILITGASGFIAGHIADLCSLKGHKITLVDLKKPNFTIKKNQKFIKCNILNKKKLEKIFLDHDIVFHFAAIADLFHSNENIYETIKNNIIGTANILEAIKKNRVKKIIYASSIYAISEQGGIYSTSKLSSEMIIEDYSKKFNLKFVILRFGSIYGPRSNSFNTLKNFINDAFIENKIFRNSDGNEVRNYINVADVAKLSYKVISKKYDNNYYNIFGPKKYQLKEILYLIKKNFFPKLKLKFNKNGILKYNYKISPFTYSLRKGRNLKLKRYVNLKSGIKQIIDNEKK